MREIDLAGVLVVTPFVLAWSQPLHFARQVVPLLEIGVWITLLVTTSNGAGTQHSVIDWRSFSVPAGSTTHFLQPDVDSTSINRVTGNKPSEIFGTLSSNGRLVLVNPSGIAVGQGAVIDTAGFTASALAMSDADV